MDPRTSFTAFSTTSHGALPPHSSAPLPAAPSFDPNLPLLPTYPSIHDLHQPYPTYPSPPPPRPLPPSSSYPSFAPVPSWTSQPLDFAYPSLAPNRLEPAPAPTLIQPSNDDLDLANLRMFQRQRKRESSSATQPSSAAVSSSSSSSIRPSHDASSALLGFAGSNATRANPTMAPAPVRPRPPIPPLPPALPLDPTWPFPAELVLPPFAANPGPVVASTSSDPTFDAYPSYPETSLVLPNEAVISSSYPTVPFPNRTEPSRVAPAGEFETKTATNAADDVAHDPLRHSTRRSDATTLSGPFDSELPPPPSHATRDVDLLDPRIVPILELGVEIRKRHRSLPPPLSTRPARGKGSTAIKARATSRTSDQGGGEGASLGTEEDGEGGREETRDGGAAREDDAWEWRIGKSCHQKVNAVEVKIRCSAACRRVSSTTTTMTKTMNGSNRVESQHCGPKIARVVLRNLSDRILATLEEISQANERPAPGRRGNRSPSGTTVDEDDPGWSDPALPWTSSSLSASTTSSERSWPNPLPEQLGISITNPSCLACTRVAPACPASPSLASSSSTTTTSDRVGAEPKERGYADTLSAAIDRFEAMTLQGGSSATSPNGSTPRREGDDPWDRREGSRVRDEAGIAPGDDEDGGRGGAGRRSKREAQGWKSLVHVRMSEVPKDHLKRILKCDVCDLACGLCTIAPTPSSSSSSLTSAGAPFTVEVICARCDALFKICSSCGGGGGRLTPGRWRCAELFPNGRRNCLLSHARNPTLDEISFTVNPVKSLAPDPLAESAAACRKLFFQTRLGTLCRPEFMLNGDGLARTYEEAEKMCVDFWGRLNELLYEDLPESSPVKRYLVMTYSQHQRRQNRKPSSSTKTKPGLGDPEHDGEGVDEPDAPEEGNNKRKGKKDRGEKKVPYAFSIVEVDFSVGLLFFCCVIPWATSGQSFEVNSLLVERTNARVKADLADLNRARVAVGLAPYPRVRYNYLVSPFRLDSKNSASLNRRGFLTLDQLERVDPGLDRTLFPPYREIWLPAHYSQAMHVFVRKLESEDDLGGAPAENAPRKRKKVAPTSS
ncbi:hypothetical protein JCM10212_002438 [Sporobolomyces blumeae]